MRKTYGSVLGKESEKVALCEGTVASWGSECMEQSCRSPFILCGTPSCGNPADTACGAFPSIPDKHIELRKQRAYPKKKRKVRSMSFAGVGAFQGKIIGFADRKSSVSRNGILCEDPERQTVKKIWRGRDYIIAFTGTNSFLSVPELDADGFATVYMEDWIEEHYKDFDSPDELCVRLFRFIRSKSELDFGTINAIFVQRNGDGISYTSADIAYRSVKFTAFDPVNGMFLLSGVDAYRDMLMEDVRNVVTTDEERLKRELNGFVQAYNSENGGYNPVGCGWDVFII